MNGDASTLSAEGLWKTYGGRAVVQDVSFRLESGQIVGLLGKNGAGKTTTFYMVVGLIRPDRGRVLLGGQNIARLPMYRRARRGISYLPQEPSVFRKMTVRDNILSVLEMMGLGRRERRERLEQLLEELDLTHLATHKSYTLSGGERRRVEITRALATEPAFILLDEPFASIDPIAVLELQKLVQQLAERGIGVLITDHNVEKTLEITDLALIINEGRILASGSPVELAEDPLVRQVYLGERFELSATAQERARRRAAAVQA
jgi:lipopolysaccharide export system ATP-binding protein